MAQNNNRTISWDDLNLVLTIAKECSMLGAAKKMNVNASTVSRRLDALEEEWQTHIFNRTNKGLEKTDLTEQLLPFAKAAEQAVNGFIQVIESYEKEAVGTVTISAPPGVASNFLAPKLPSIRQRHPHIQIHIDAETEYVDLTRRKADIALRTSRPQSGDLVAKRLTATKDMVMAHPEYCKTLGLVRSWDQIEWLSWGHKLAHLEVSEWLTKRVPEHAIVVRSDSFDVLFQSAKSGTGAMLVDETLGEQAGLEKIQLDPSLETELDTLSERTIWLVGHRALRNVPRISAVWESLLESSQNEALK
jgi:DNA-binding transcriptional LysR family regulator